MKEALANLLARNDLPRQETERLFRTILSGEANEAQVGAFLALMQAKGPTLDEIVGGARAMRAYLTPVKIPEGVDPDTIIDTCGTGGAPKTFNISTASAIVVAACDHLSVRVRVAKHGGKSRSGRGSAEVLGAMGVNIDATPQAQSACLKNAGVCFSFAVHHHPAMRFAAGPRKSLGFPTIFNLLGPLTNPASAPRQLLGVYDEARAELVARALAELGTTRAMVVHGHDGLDELTTTAPNTVYHVRAGSVTQETLDARDFGIERTTLEAIQTNTLDEAVALLRSILRGEPSPALDITILNAGAALVVGGAAETVAEGIDAARTALHAGNGERTLALLADSSRA